MLVASTLIWGSSFFILKNTLDYVGVYFLLSVRFLISALLLSVVFFGKWKLFNMKYVIFGLITGLLLGLAYIFQTVGLKHTTPGTNAFLTEFYCVLVPFMCWAVMKKKPDKYNVIAAFVCIIGIGLVCLDGGKAGFSFMGEGFTLICSLFFGMQMIAIEIWGKELDSVLFTIFQFIGAFIVNFMIFLFTEKVPSHIPADCIWSIIYVSVFATAVAYVFMSIGIKHTSASYSSLIFCLEAVFGVAFSMIFYHERLSLQVGCGFAVIFTGIIVNETKLSFLRRGNVKKEKK